MRVVLGVGVGTGILELGVARAWPWLVPPWTREAGGEVASLQLLGHVFVVAEFLHGEVLAGVEDGGGDLTAACGAVHLLPGGGHGERSKGACVLLGVRLVRRGHHWASEVGRKVLLWAGLEGGVSVRVAWWSANADELVFWMLLSGHEGRGRRSGAVDSVHSGVGLRWTWRLEHVEVLVRHGCALLGHLLRLELRAATGCILAGQLGLLSPFYNIG